MQVLIKAQLANHFRRFNVLLESESKNECDGGNADLGRGVKDSVDGGRVYGYPLLIQTIRKVFGISDLYGIRVSYLDDEGDWITISSQQEFIEGAKIGVTDETGDSSLQIRVEIVELDSFTSTHHEELDPMSRSIYHSLDVSVLGLSSSQSPTTSNMNSRSRASDGVPKELIDEYVSAIMDGTRPEFVAVSRSAGGGGMNATADMNEFHYHRVIIQTAITQTLIRLIGSEGGSGVEGISGIDYKRIIVQTGIQRSVRCLFNDDGAEILKEKSTLSIRDALDSLTVSSATLVDGIYEKSRVVADEIVKVVTDAVNGNAGRRAGENLAVVGRGLLPGVREVRAVIGGLTTFLTEVGGRMAEDPFSGMRFEPETIKFPPRKSSLVRKSSLMPEASGDESSSGSESSGSGDSTASQMSEIQMTSVDDSESVAESVAESPISPSDIPTSSSNENAEVVTEPIEPTTLDTPTPSNITNPFQDPTLEDLLAPIESIPPSSPETSNSTYPFELEPQPELDPHPFESIPIEPSTASTIQSPTINHFDLPLTALDTHPILSTLDPVPTPALHVNNFTWQPISVDVVDDAMSEADMIERDHRAIDGDGDENVGDDEEFVFVDEDMGMQSSILVFPVL